MTGVVTAVSAKPGHDFSKDNHPAIRLLTGVGVEGDGHAGATVQHRSRVRRDPTQPNLRQVHLLHAELHDELAERGFDVRPGQLGENITTRGLRLLDLPRGTILCVGDEAIVEVTGLRNPCRQIDDFRKGVLAAVLDRDEEHRLVRKSGVMGVVVAGGEVRRDDRVEARLPTGPHLPLEPV
ncbi:MAG: MOSC domain-containing protein [Nocardioidaceae bacterium]|nr:MOSC domain-containing protein [Nocardioidaceae bacterium]